MGAALRSMAGSPACTATVSECGIGSAYLKAFEAEHLIPIANALQQGEACIHLTTIAGHQGSLAPDTRRVWPRAYCIEKAYRSIEPGQIVLHAPQRALQLSLNDREFTPAAEFEERQQTGRGWHSFVIQQQVETSLEPVHLELRFEKEMLNGG